LRALKKITYIGGVFWRFRFYILCTLLVLGLWDTVLIKPFRFFVVMVHEVCHAGMALITGGQVVEIRTNWNESGQTLTQGGIFPLISAAGYMGSALVGALLIYTGIWPQAQRLALAVLGAVCLGMTVLFTPFGGVDFYVGIGGGFLLLALAIQSQKTARVGAVWMGVMLCLYSLHDFRTDLWLYPEMTDAGILANHWGMPWLAYPIAFIWVLISISVMYRAMRRLIKHGGKSA
jgi:hypothetical protein